MHELAEFGTVVNIRPCPECGDGIFTYERTFIVGHTIVAQYREEDSHDCEASCS